MKKFFLFTALFAAVTSYAQDTTWVQTFTFDTIVSRHATFQFPQELDTARFAKVLMYYKLKCSPLTTWDNYNCGEWDYLTYTRVFDHTGVMDSVEHNYALFRVNTLSPVVYPYLNNAFFDKRYVPVQRVSPNVVNYSTFAGSNAGTLPLVISGTNGAKMQWIIPASQLASSGIVTGDIQSLQLQFLQAVSMLEGVKIRIKSTLSSSLTAFETTGFTTVFDDEFNGLGIGLNTFHFSTPFNWDGSSNLIIELSFSDPNALNQLIELATYDAAAGENTLLYSNQNGVFSTNASNYAELNLQNVELNQDFTITFWTKGTGNFGTNTSILEAVDSLNQRVLNIHMPWSDNNMYFDAGQGSGYDRISKAMTANEADNNWHHWAFVKRTSTGEMFIYKDGSLWHSGTGKNTSVGRIHRFYLGSSWNQAYQYKGDIDEFTIFKSALSAATIASYKDLKLTPTHPNYGDVELYYDFDDQQAIIDRTANNHLGMCSDATMIQHNNEPVAGVASLSKTPQVGLGQGTYMAAVSDSILRTDFPVTDVVFNYTALDNYFEIASNQLTYAQGSADLFAANGTALTSTPMSPDATLMNDTLVYYDNPFEVVNEVEIGRYITPYGIGFDLGPQGFTWVYDVTDYQKYLHGAVDLAAHNTQELIDLKFAFVHGIPARDVHDVKPIWENYRSYLYKDMDNDDVLSEVAIPLSDSSDMFKIKTRFTGHGHNGTTNCCEWDPKTHQIMVNGTPRFNWSIWQSTECGENPNIGQGGTWPYAREGWCPGDMVKEWDHELTPYVQPGDTVHLDYDISAVPANDQAQGNGNYVVAMDLVSYSAPNFQHDAAIADVLNPNNYEYYSKFNPTCSNPRIILQNNGEQALTSCIIRCWVTYGAWVEYNWTGNLGFLEKEVVEIPINDQTFWFGANPDNGFHTQVYAVQGYPDLDEYSANNYKVTKYSAPEMVTNPFLIWLKTNNKANENSYKLMDEAGNTIFERTTLLNSTDYKDTFNLEPGCYSVIIEDTDHDGLSFWYSAQVEGETSGFMRVKEVGGPIIEGFPGDFGKYHRYDFSVGFEVGLSELENKDEFYVFPNPATDDLHLEYFGNVGNNATLTVTDVNGRVILQKTVANQNNSYLMDLTVNELMNGMYFIQLSGSAGSKVTQFIKQ